MNEYLDVWAHIAKKKKNGWRISDISRNVEEALQLGDKVVRWAALDTPKQD